MSAAAAAAAGAGAGVGGLVLHLAPAAPAAVVPASAAALPGAAAALPAASAALPGAAAAAAAAALPGAAGAPPPPPPPPPGPAAASGAPLGPTAEQIAAINAYTGINDGQSFQNITTIITEYHTHYPIELRPLHIALGLTDADISEANRISLNTLSYVYLYSQQINLHLGDPEFKYIRKQFFNFFSEVYQKYNPINPLTNKRKFNTFPLPLSTDQQYIGDINDNFSSKFLNEFNTIMDNMNNNFWEIGHRERGGNKINDFADWYLYLYFLQDAHTRLIDEVNHKLKFKGNNDSGTEITTMGAGLKRTWHTKYPLVANSVFKEDPQTVCDLLPIKDKTSKEFDLLDLATLPAIWKLCDEIFS
jgi:hypothetical protein